MRRIGIVLALALSCACQSTSEQELKNPSRRIPMSADFQVDGRRLVREGETTLDELVLALGEPDACSGDGRLLFYSSRTGEGEWLGVIPTGERPTGTEHLFLAEFDDRWVLRRYTLRAEAVSDPDDWEYALFESWRVAPAAGR